MDKFIENNLENMISDLRKLVNIPSVYEKSCKKGEPFGVNVNEALLYVLNKGRELGFEVKNYDGYAGEINAGRGEYIIGILCHVDVVDGGDGWSTPAFESKVIDNKIFGRGTIDDKGPIVSCLYAMKYLNENNFISNKNQIRMIVGTNEEEEWKGIKYYVKKAEMPNISFVPDANFPLIYGEKGVFDFDLSYEIRKPDVCSIKLINMSGGTARNAVPSQAECKLKVDLNCINEICEEINKYIIKQKLNAEISKSESNIIIKAYGKSTHAMSPEKGKNAISILLNILSIFEEKKFSAYDFVSAYNKYIGMDYYGGRFECNDFDDASGPLTFNIGKISFKKQKVFLNANIRYPMTKDFITVEEKVLKTSKAAGFNYKLIDHLKPINNDKDSDIVKCLMKVYQNVTGDNISRPITIGGATYARAIPNSAAFGPVFPNQEELAHEADEYISISDFKMITQIYCEAMKELMK